MKKQWIYGNSGRFGELWRPGWSNPVTGFVGGILCVLMVCQCQDDAVTMRKPPMKVDAQTTLAASSDPHSHRAKTGIIRPRLLEDSAEVRVSGARLSVNVSNRSLQEVVSEIGRQSDVAIVLGEGVPNSSVAVEFQEIPLEQGLRRLLRDYDTFFFFSRTEEAPARLTTVWVYPPGQGQRLAPIPSTPESVREEWAQAVEDPDALKRALAIAAMAERHGQGASEAVKAGLVDFDERVRVEALQAALTAPVEVPVELLRDMVRHDPSAVIRSIALAGLANQAEQGTTQRDTVWELLDSARSDPDPAVSELAAHISESWEEAAVAGADSGVTEQEVTSGWIQ